MWAQRLLSDSRVLFLIGVIAGFIFTGVASMLEPFLIWIGVVLMTATLMDVRLRDFHLQNWSTIGSLLALNYVLLSGAYLAVAGLFDPPYMYAILFLAVMPPSIGIISMTHILHGNDKMSFYTECVAYGVSLVGIPLAAWLFLGDTVSIWPVVRIVGLLLILPVVLSRVLRRVLDQRFASLNSVVKPVFNVCYALSFFTVIGVNRDALLSNPWLVLSFAAVLAVIKFGFSTAVHLGLRDRFRRPDDVDAVLFASFKNGGMAVIFVISVLGVGASLPLAVNSLLAPLHIVFIEYALLPVLR